MRVRIVVADRGEARFYDSARIDAPLRPAGQLSDAKGHLHDRDFKSDRPGRVFDRAPPASGRRGAVAHHGTGGERKPHKHEAELFARRIIEALTAASADGFDGLVLMSGPSFLGLLRAALPKTLHEKVVGEVPKDLVHQHDEAALRAHLTREMFEP